MRTLLVSSMSICAVVALTAPVAVASPAGHAPAGHHAGHPPPARSAPAADPVPGSTQSVPLAPVKRSDRALRDGVGARAVMGLPARDVKPFSLVGVVWRDPAAKLHGEVQVRTRGSGDGRWSGWRNLEANSDDAPDPGSAEARGSGVRGSTAPLWVGGSDAVQVRVVAADAADKAREAFPDGLRVELIDPGPAGTGPKTLPDTEAAGARTPAAYRIAPLSKRATRAEAVKLNQELPRAARPFIGPRPGIVTRRGWGADESLRGSASHHMPTVEVAFVHHTATGNGYRCSQAPALIRGIYRYHVRSLGWDDIGYNFLVDRCGRIYEGRAGGVTRAVQGAHTLGFNRGSMGVAVLGSFGSARPSVASVRAVEQLAAWKLGLFGRDPRGTAVLVSAGGTYAQGRQVRMHVIAGHRDGYATDCPGIRLYSRLGSARSTSARLQGR